MDLYKIMYELGRHWEFVLKYQIPDEVLEFLHQIS